MAAGFWRLCYEQLTPATIPSGHTTSDTSMPVFGCRDAVKDRIFASRILTDLFLNDLETRQVVRSLVIRFISHADPSKQPYSGNPTATAGRGHSGHLIASVCYRYAACRLVLLRRDQRSE
jgi:hypothetical protein